MASTGPGFGRGGRGAALLQALNAPVRKPGQASPPQASATGVPLPAPVGRGAMLQHMLASTKVPVSVPPGQVPVTSKPLGRGMTLATAAAPVVPMGRGMRAQQLAAQAKVSPPRPAVATPPRPAVATPPRPIGRGSGTAVPQAATQQVVDRPSAQQVVYSRPLEEPPKQEDPKAGGDKKWLSRLEYMLEKASLNEPAVVRKGKFGQEIPLSANHILVSCKTEGVFQYAVDFKPQVDSKSMRFKLLDSMQHVIGDVKAFDGAILFLPIRLEQKEIEERTRRPTDGAEVLVTIKLVKIVPHEACVQLYNVIFRRVMTMLKFCQVGRHYYDPHNPAQVPQHRLEVWPGYITTITQTEGGLMMLTDVSHRVLRTETVYDLIASLYRTDAGRFKDETVRKVVGCTVLTRYNNKTYRVDDIAWDQTPTTPFTLSNGEQCTFAEYYMKTYNKKIEDLDQPLLIHRPKQKDQMRQGRKALDVICLIPELCFLTGLSDDMRNDFKVMKDLAFHTRVTPGQRQISLRKFCENVNSHKEARDELAKWGLVLENETIQISGRKLPPEDIFFKNSKTSAGLKASWDGAVKREQMISGVTLENWAVLFVGRDERNASSFVQLMGQVGGSIGMQVGRPILRQLANDRTEAYLKQLKDVITPRMQLVVIIFPTSRDDRYNAVKKLCCAEKPIASQVIISRTLSKKDPRSIVQKIALQINAKLGGELWAVDIPSKKPTMIVGIDTYHDPAKKLNSVVGFVASMNQRCTRWHSSVTHQMGGQELGEGLKMCMMRAIRRFHKENHTLPERIIIFRDGVGDGQLKTVADWEVPQVATCFAHFDAGYSPQLAHIVVQKRINQRIFGVNRRQRELTNPPPGTILDHTITRRDWYDFFLVSQHVGQGTVSPSHYVVVHDQSGLDSDKLQRLSYKMTHMYYNWPGTIRVPAPCQYAHKLAQLVGMNIKTDPSDDLMDKLFFL